MLASSKLHLKTQAIWKLISVLALPGNNRMSLRLIADWQGEEERARRRLEVL